MQTEKINSELIGIMKNRVPPGTNLAHLLMDMLCLGKEAVYRRLRGEVPFTLAEAATVSAQMGLSLDKLIGSAKCGNAVFDINIADKEDPARTYYEILERYAAVFKSIEGDDTAEMASSSNIIPNIFSMKYEWLGKFRLYKWMYQNCRSDMIKPFQQFVLPDKIVSGIRTYNDLISSIAKMCFIWDGMLFTSLVNDLNYFLGIQLMTREDIERIKEDIHAMICEMETVVAKGEFSSGAEVQLYISNINFESTYGYIESRNVNTSLIRIYSLNSLTTSDPGVFEDIKEWIRSLKKFSILISQSGEMQRIKYFNTQRDILKQLG